MYLYKVDKVIKIIDGDTVDLLVDVGFSIKIKHRFRLEKYDAPETYRPLCEAEKIGGEKVTKFLKYLLEIYKDYLFVETSKLGIYGRYSATIFIGSDKADNINLRVADFIKLNKLSKDELRSNIEYEV